jgi:hypothetical protein
MRSERVSPAASICFAAVCTALSTGIPPLLKALFGLAAGGFAGFFPSDRLRVSAPLPDLTLFIFATQSLVGFKGSNGSSNHGTP